MNYEKEKGKRRERAKEEEEDQHEQPEEGAKKEEKRGIERDREREIESEGRRETGKTQHEECNVLRRLATVCVRGLESKSPRSVTAELIALLSSG